MSGKRSEVKSKAAELPRIVLVDANVFFAPRMRDLFMHLHEAEVIHVHWTRKIEHEWVRNVVAKQDADPESIQECLKGMRDAAEGWEVSGYGSHLSRFEAVDAKDRHVAAAALKLSLTIWPGRKVALVTRNVKDFPQHAFDGTEVTRYSMAGYLDLLFNENPEAVVAVAEGCRKKLRNPKYTRELYVAVLMKNGCGELADALAVRWNVERPIAAQDGTLTFASDVGAVPSRQAQKRSKAE